MGIENESLRDGWKEDGWIYVHRTGLRKAVCKTSFAKIIGGCIFDSVLYGVLVFLDRVDV